MLKKTTLKEPAADSETIQTDYICGDCLFKKNYTVEKKWISMQKMAESSIQIGMFRKK